MWIYMRDTCAFQAREHHGLQPMEHRTLIWLQECVSYTCDEDSELCVCCTGSKSGIGEAVSWLPVMVFEGGESLLLLPAPPDLLVVVV